MLKANSDIIYNDNCLVIVHKNYTEYFDALEFSFKNVILFDEDEGIYNIYNFINRNNFKQIVFIDYSREYETIIGQLSNDEEVKVIFTKSLGSFSENKNYDMFKKILELYKQNNISKIGVLDKNLYLILKNKKVLTSHVILDLPLVKSRVGYNKKNIGILGNSNNPRHSFYNALSAIKFKDYIANLASVSDETKKFLRLFKIKSIKTKENYKNNLLNLYINFTDNNNLNFIRSMDFGVPCIIGNCDINIDNDYLKKMLFINSDDNIDEICKKIKLVEKNRKEIIEEFKRIRKDYSDLSKNSIEDFLEYKIINKIEEKSDLLLSVVVPVYNTEKYLNSCLKSIIRALPKKIVNYTEILIINDGSTDASESIILKYQKRYSNLIKYTKQKNKGLGNVRNVGLKLARGKYIASIDSDDTINKNFFKEAISYMEKDIDIIMYDWLSIMDNAKYQTSAIEWCLNDIKPYEGLLYTTIMPSTCNKIIKKQLYENLKIKYNEDKYEDLSTNPFIMLTAKTLKYIKKPYYEYFIRSNSIMRSSAGYSMIKVLKLVEKRMEKYSNSINIDTNKFKYYTYSWRIEEFIFNQMYSMEKEKLEEFINCVYDNLFDIILNVFENDHYNAMLNNISLEKKKYILQRNEAFKNKNLLNFIIKVKSIKKYYKLTAPLIYFGENN